MLGLVQRTVIRMNLGCFQLFSSAFLFQSALVYDCHHAYLSGTARRGRLA